MGLERITGEMHCPLSEEKLEELFPSKSSKYGRKLGVQAPVDYMVGMDRPDWQPLKVLKSEYGGDF